MCTYFAVGMRLHGDFRRMNPRRALVGFFSAHLFGGYTNCKSKHEYMLGLAKRTKKFIIG
ncbi:MAG: hypothetical protein K2F90_06365 [Clostridiales bacterium]|nr:hypothetical protein [Clostridiales bacterium]